MNLLLDAQLDTAELIVSRALNVFASRHGCHYRALRAENKGLKDPEIPPYCKQEQIDALVSFKVKHFAAKLELFKALLDSGISVVALRPRGNEAFTPERQLALLSLHSKQIGKWLREAKEPLLLRCTFSEVKRLSLNELRTEIESKTRMLP